MKVALVAPMVAPLIPEHGGTQAVLHDLALAMSAHHDVTLIAPRGSDVPAVDVVTIDVDAAAEEDLFRPHAGWHRPRPDVLSDAYRKVAEVLRAEQFDVVHNHGADPQALEVLTERCTLVHTLHLPPDPEMADAMKQHRHRLTVVAVSHALDRDWMFIADRVVHNGIPTADIPWYEEHDGYLLFAGRLSPEKGPSDAIAIARQAGLPCRIVGGAYDPDCAEEIEGLSDELVEVLGVVPRTDLWKMMSRAAAVLVPSRWEEPFGMVAAESQAAGCPVIAYRRGALPEVVSHGETGILVEEGDIGGAARAVEKVLKLDRRAIRAAAVERFDTARMVSGYESVYEQHRSKEEAWSASRA